LFHVADLVEVYHQADGVRAAVDVARARRARHFDPAIVDAFCTAADEVLCDGQDAPDCHELIATEPALQRHLTEAELDDRLEALADFTDLRSTYRAHRAADRDAGRSSRLGRFSGGLSQADRR
jgi:hypothetical protein